MLKKKVFVSVGAAVILILASLTSVIAFRGSESSVLTVESPLFRVRTSRSIGQKSEFSLNTMFLGKGRSMSLFLSEISSTNSIIERGLQLLQTSPALVERYLQKMLADPQMQETLRQHAISEQMVFQYFNQAKQTPEMLAGQIAESIEVIPGFDSPQPLGMLNTSNALACVITIIALLPVILVLGIIIATITIVTCLNVNNCLNTLINNLIQGLKKPSF